MTVCTLLSPVEFDALRDKHRALLEEAKKLLGDMAWEEMCKLPQIKPLLFPNFLPVGAMWYAPWYHDPQDPEDMARRQEILGAPQKNTYLSIHYWQDWSDKRPPISVICPGGCEWVVDARSTNGSGWTITGDAPLITASPSIQTSNYHGWLRNGVFTSA